MASKHQHPELSSTEAEDRFRRIFFSHLLDDGFTEADAERFIFKTPDNFHRVPTDDHGFELLEASREHYRRQLPCSWFFEGLRREPARDEACLEAPARPVTFVVVPGIFGEFIEQVPFQEAVRQPGSRFARKWQEVLEGIEDKVHTLLELDTVPCRLSEVMEIGSLDQGNRSFANIVVLNPPPGSLETLGTLASNAEIFARRLSKFFAAAAHDTDIYLVGYSRGLATALELVSSLHEQDRSGTAPAWFARLRGVVGLGGVFYGANFAHQVLTGKSGATSDLVKLLYKTSAALATVPEGAKMAEKTEILMENTRVWAAFAKAITGAKTPRVAEGKSFIDFDLAEVFTEEGKARILGSELPAPNPWGIFGLVNNFFLKTFSLKKSVSRYNENILALKQLVEAVVGGVHTLTPASRNEWWLEHELPENLELFSVTGTMPDMFLGELVSPLWRFPGYGARTSDFNISLRASYYDTVAAEGTMLNDSQVSHFCSRYWAEMYPEHRYNHYYLGVLGAHHWGMGFPYTIKDDQKIGANAFPRTTLLRSVAAFIASLDENSNPDTD